jgi:hypothetical protein
MHARLELEPLETRDCPSAGLAAGPGHGDAHHHSPAHPDAPGHHAGPSPDGGNHLDAPSRLDQPIPVRGPQAAATPPQTLTSAPPPAVPASPAVPVPAGRVTGTASLQLGPPPGRAVAVAVAATLKPDLAPPAPPARLLLQGPAPVLPGMQPAPLPFPARPTPTIPSPPGLLPTLVSALAGPNFSVPEPLTGRTSQGPAPAGQDEVAAPAAEPHSCWAEFALGGLALEMAPLGQEVRGLCDAVGEALVPREGGPSWAVEAALWVLGGTTAWAAWQVASAWRDRPDPPALHSHEEDHLLAEGT